MMGRVKFPSSNRLTLSVFCLALSATAVWGQSPETLASSPGTRSGANFVVARALSLAGKPTSVATGDLNGDGRPDLVITKAGSASVTVLLGDGNGGFAPGVTYLAGGQPGSVLVADLNGDGKLDVAVTDAVSGSVEILSGNGDGTLGAVSRYSGIANPVALALGNFYGNGKIDLAVASSTGVVVLRNDQTGHFSAGTFYAVSGQPVSVAAADLSGSGHDDLIVGSGDGTVSLLMGDGSGHFNALPAVSVGPGSLSAVVAGDFNGDGRPDLAISEANAGKVTVLLGLGNGSYQPGTSYRVGNSPQSLIAANLNGGATTDLVAVNQAANTFSVLMGNGDGTFQAAQDYVAGNGPLAAVAGRFYGGAQNDLAVVNYGDGTVSLAAGLGNGAFRAARSYAADLQRKSIAAGDLNGDGISDLVVTNYCGSDASCAGNGSASVFLGNPNGTYRQATTLPLGSGPVAASLADVNGDGKLDLLVLNRTDKTLTTMLGTGNGSFGSSQTLALSGSPTALYVGDLNGDGKADVAIASDCGQKSCTQPGALDVWLGKGDGTYTKAASYPYTVGFSPVSIAGGVLSAGGHVDLVVANACGQDSTCNSAGTATILAGDGTGKFSVAGEIALGKAPSSIALAKVGAGSLSLVVAESGSNDVLVLPGDGNGGFGAATRYAVGTGPSSLTVADLNGDGIKDVAVANFQSSTVSVLYGTSTGALQTASTFTVGTGPESMAAVNTSVGSMLVTGNGNGGATPMGNSITVVAAATGTTANTTTLASSSTTSVVDQQVTFTATVTGATTAPTGNVVFAIDNGSGSTTPLGDCGGATGIALTAGSGASSTAACTTQLMPAGNPVKVQAQYLGDSTYAISTSSDVNEHVTAANTSAAVTSSPTTGFTVDQPIIFTTTVLPNPVPTVNTDVVPFTGTISFSGGALSGCATQSTTNANGYGYATCTSSALQAGTATISGALNSDDLNYNATTSGNITTESVTVAAAATSVTVNSVYATGTATAPTVDQTVTITATVAPSASNATLPVAVPFSGTISFSVDGTAIASCSGSNAIAVNTSTGAASCAIPTGLSVGSHSVTAAYNTGDSNYSASAVSSGFSVTVNKAATAVTLTPASQTATVDSSVTLTATVTPNVTTAFVGSSNVATISGTVAFSDNGTVISGCSAVTVFFSATNGNATASCATKALTGGSHTNVTATYSGDTSYLTSPASSAVTVTMNPAGTSTAVASSTSGTSNVNQSVTFTATVTPTPSSPTIPLSGNVTFSNSGGSITCTESGTAVVPIAWSGTNLNGTATCTTSALPATSGHDVITASYNADNSDSSYSKSSGTVNQVVNAVASTISSFTASPSPANFNSNVILTAVVTPYNSPVPLTGTVSFTIGGKSVSGCTVAFTPSTGTATCDTTALAVGTYTITATYSGDSSYTTSSATTSETVNQVASSLSLAAQPANSSTVNQQATFTATLSVPTPPKNATGPSGTVQFTDLPSGATTATVICNSVGLSPGTSSGGVSTYTAQCPISTLVVGGHTITATYGGDSNYTVSTPATLPYTVNKANSTTQVAPSSQTGSVNQSLTFQATVSGPSGSATPTGTVSFTDTISGTTTAIATCQNVTIASGVYSCTTDTLVAGTHTITANYSGDGNFNSSSGTASATIGSATTQVGLVASPTSVIVKNPNNYNDTVMLTATVSVPKGSNSASGTITFTYNGSLSIPECPTAIAIDANNSASCTTSSLPAGADTVTATYSGSNNFKGSAFNAQVAVQSYSLAVSGLTNFNGTPSAFVTQGYTTSNDPFTPSTITLTPTSNQGFSSTAVAISCAAAVVSAPSGAVAPTCSSSPASITVASSGAQPTSAVVVDATNATPGLYAVTVTGTDSATGLPATATFDVFVFGAPLSIVSGSTTGNSTTALIPLPANISLSNIHCAFVAGPGNSYPGVAFDSTGYSSEYSMGCTANPTSVAAQQSLQSAQITVTFTTGGSTAVAAVDHQSTVWLAGLFGLPLFGLMGLLRGRKSARSVFLRVIAIVALCASAYQVIGCGGSFTKPPASGGQTPPGAYTVTVEGTGSDGHTYQAIVHVNVTL